MGLIDGEEDPNYDQKVATDPAVAAEREAALAAADTGRTQAEAEMIVRKLEEQKRKP